MHTDEKCAAWEIIHNMPDTLYHARPELSSTQIKRFIKSPLHYRNVQDEDTAAMRYGRGVHGLTLQPEQLFKHNVVLQVKSRNTNAYREACKVHGDKEIFLQHEIDEMTDIACAVRADEYAAPLLQGALTEVSLFWLEQGRPARARLDAWQPDDGVIIDLKTCDDASPEAFARAVIKYGYHISAEWYRRGVESCGKPFRAWYWIAVEKKPPYAVQVYKAEAPWFDFAAARIDVALRYMAECEAADKWPSYADGIFNLALPAWAGI